VSPKTNELRERANYCCFTFQMYKSAMQGTIKNDLQIGT